MDIELREILNKVYANEMKPDEAQWKICVLFNVSNTEEELICPICNCNKAYWNPIEEYNECPCGHNWTD
jgi:hypothetical protein